MWFFPRKAPPCPLPHIHHCYISYINISLLHPRWDEQCRDTMMTVPPQLTSSLASFSYPASFRHPPPASSFFLPSLGDFAQWNCCVEGALSVCVFCRATLGNSMRLCTVDMLHQGAFSEVEVTCNTFFVLVNVFRWLVDGSISCAAVAVGVFSWSNCVRSRRTNASWRWFLSLCWGRSGGVEARCRDKRAERLIFSLKNMVPQTQRMKIEQYKSSQKGEPYSKPVFQTQAWIKLHFWSLRFERVRNSPHTSLPPLPPRHQWLRIWRSGKLEKITMQIEFEKTWNSTI